MKTKSAPGRIALVVLLAFSYGTAFSTMTADPITWVRPALAMVAGLFLLPGAFIVGLPCHLAGIDMAALKDGEMLVVSASVLFWLAAGAVLRLRRRQTPYVSAAE